MNLPALLNLYWKPVALASASAALLSELIYMKDDLRKELKEEETKTQEVAAIARTIFVTAAALSATYGNPKYAMGLMGVTLLYSGYQSLSRSTGPEVESNDPGFEGYRNCNVILALGILACIAKISYKPLMGIYQKHFTN